MEAELAKRAQASGMKQAEGDDLVSSEVKGRREVHFGDSMFFHIEDDVEQSSGPEEEPFPPSSSGSEESAARADAMARREQLQAWHREQRLAKQK